MRIVCTPRLGREELISAGTSGRDEVVSGFNLFQLCSRGYQVSHKVVLRAFPLCLLTWNNRTCSQKPQHHSEARFSFKTQ